MFRKKKHTKTNGGWGHRYRVGDRIIYKIPDYNEKYVGTVILLYEDNICGIKLDKKLAGIRLDRPAGMKYGMMGGFDGLPKIKCPTGTAGWVYYNEIEPLFGRRK